MSAREDAVHTARPPSAHRHTPEHEHEHEFEAAHGLPEPLPAGERILWQGSPDLRALAYRVFHVRTLSWYFAAILVLRGVTAATQSGSVVTGAIAALWLLGPAVAAIAMLWLMAYMTSRTAVYTITDRRVVMRIGIVLSLTFNLPFSRIRSAAAMLKKGPIGDIALTTSGEDNIAYVHLWPHARPWRIAKTEPMLRCVVDAAGVSRILTEAWSTAHVLAAPTIVTSDAPVAASAPARPMAPAFAHAARRIDGGGNAAAAH